MNVATRTAGQEFDGGTPTTGLDVLVIGAGQAGLAAGYHLRATGLRFQLVERHARIGDSWRERFDSLALFTPRAYSHLPGLLLDGDQEGYATRDEVADYLERYAAEFLLPVRHGAAVTSLERVDGRFIATFGDGTTVEARAVIVASGAFARHSYALHGLKDFWQHRTQVVATTPWWPLMRETQATCCGGVSPCPSRTQ